MDDIFNAWLLYHIQVDNFDPKVELVWILFRQLWPVHKLCVRELRNVEKSNFTLLNNQA